MGDDFGGTIGGWVGYSVGEGATQMPVIDGIAGGYIGGAVGSELGGLTGEEFGEWFADPRSRIPDEVVDGIVNGIRGGVDMATDAANPMPSEVIVDNPIGNWVTDNLGPVGDIVEGVVNTDDVVLDPYITDEVLEVDELEQQLRERGPTYWAAMAYEEGLIGPDTFPEIPEEWADE